MDEKDSSNIFDLKMSKVASAAVTDITQFLFQNWSGRFQVYNVLPTKQECMDGRGKCTIEGGH